MAALLPGCFSYIPTELESVPQGRQVRVYLGREALLDFRDIVVMEEPFVTGTLMRSDGDRFLLRVPVATRRQGFLVENLGQDMFIQTDQVVQLERREINKLGTGLVAVGSTAFAGALIFMIIDGALNGDRPPVPGDNEARIPIFNSTWR